MKFISAVNVLDSQCIIRGTIHARSIDSVRRYTIEISLPDEIRYEIFCSVLSHIVHGKKP